MKLLSRVGLTLTNVVSSEHQLLNVSVLRHGLDVRFDLDTMRNPPNPAVKLAVVETVKFVGKPGRRTGSCSGKCMENPGRQASYPADW